MSHTRLLLTVTGPDHPGIIAALSRLIADASAQLVDIEQVVVQRVLMLSFLMDVDEPSRPELSRALEAKVAALGLQARLSSVSPLISSPDEQRDFVVTLIAERLHAADLHAVSACLHAHGANIDRIQRLTDEHLAALEMLCALPLGHSPQLKRALLELSSERSIDIAVQRNDIHRRSKRLIAMDMDSTLIRIEVIDELARLGGVGEQVAKITRRAMAGELDYTQSLRERVTLLAGMDASVLEQVARELPLMPGAETLVRVLRRLGFRTAVISGGFDVPALALKARLGLDYAYSNRLEVRDGRLTGRVEGPIVDAQRKAQLLEEIALAERIPLEQTVAIGDGANDLLMIQKAGLGVAFHAKPKLREAASTSLTGGLERVLYLLGIGARDLRLLS